MKFNGTKVLPNRYHLSFRIAWNFKFITEFEIYLWRKYGFLSSPTWRWVAGQRFLASAWLLRRSEDRPHFGITSREMGSLTRYRCMADVPSVRGSNGVSIFINFDQNLNKPVRHHSLWLIMMVNENEFPVIWIKMNFLWFEWRWVKDSDITDERVWMKDFSPFSFFTPCRVHGAK